MNKITKRDMEREAGVVLEMLGWLMAHGVDPKAKSGHGGYERVVLASKRLQQHGVDCDQDYDKMDQVTAREHMDELGVLLKHLREIKDHYVLERKAHDQSLGMYPPEGTDDG